MIRTQDGDRIVPGDLVHHAIGAGIFGYDLASIYLGYAHHSYWFFEDGRVVEYEDDGWDGPDRVLSRFADAEG